MDAIETVVPLPLDQVEAKVRTALAEQGFGVLTEIDLAATVKAKLGVDRAPLKILGACNPGFAHAALELDEAVALLLPCNVVLSSTGDGTTKVSMVDPTMLMPDPAFAELAGQVRARLEAAVAALAA